MSKRKVRKDFNKSQPITVNVKGCSEDIKKQVIQGFFDVGLFWSMGYRNLSPSGVHVNSYTNLLKNAPCGTEVKDCVMWSGVAEGITPKEFFAMVYEDEPQGHPTEPEFTYSYEATSDNCDTLWIERSLCYEHTEAGKQAAILHSKAMLGIADND